MPTPAGSALKSILLSSTGQTKRRRNADDDDDHSATSSTAETAMQQQSQNKSRRMTVESLDPFKYFFTRMCGCGDILRALGGHDIIGDKTPLASPGDPQFLQRGPRHFGGTQPGSERLNFLPQPDIYTLVKADKFLYTQPQNLPVPGFNELSHFELEQQPGLFFDGQTYERIGVLQMFHNNFPWHEPGANNVPEGTRKCITPINNVFPSLFKSLTVMINGQPIITYDYAHYHYMATL